MGRGEPEPTLPLDRLDEDPGRPLRAPERLGVDRPPLLLHELSHHVCPGGSIRRQSREQVFARTKQEPELFPGPGRPWRPPRDEKRPHLLEALLVTASRPRDRPRVFHREGGVGPVEGREPEPGPLALGDRQTSQSPAVEGPLERDDEEAASVEGSVCRNPSRIGGSRLHTVEEHRLDRVLDRLRPGVHHEVSRSTHGSDSIESGLELEREDRLVLRVRVPPDRVGQSPEDGGHDLRVVLAEGLRGDEGPQVQEPERLSGRVAVQGRQVRPDALGRIERDGERVEEPIGGGPQGRVRGREPLDDDVRERPVRVPEHRGDAGVDIARAVAGVKARGPLQEPGTRRQRFLEVLRNCCKVDEHRRRCVARLRADGNPGQRGRGTPPSVAAPLRAGPAMDGSPLAFRGRRFRDMSATARTFDDPKKTAGWPAVFHSISSPRVTSPPPSPGALPGVCVRCARRAAGRRDRRRLPRRWP